MRGNWLSRRRNSLSSLLESESTFCPFANLSQMAWTRFVRSSRVSPQKRQTSQTMNGERWSALIKRASQRAKKEANSICFFYDSGSNSFRWIIYCPYDFDKSRGCRRRKKKPVLAPITQKQNSAGRKVSFVWLQMDHLKSRDSISVSFATSWHTFERVSLKLGDFERLAKSKSSK